MLTDNKYGYRGYDNKMTVTLLHSSYDPDRYPEFGIHNTLIALAVCRTGSDMELMEQSALIAHPVYVLSNTAHQGDLQLQDSFLEVEGNVRVSAVKMPESGIDNQLVLRLYHTGNRAEEATLRFRNLTVAAANDADIMENPMRALDIIGDKVNLTLQPNTMRTLLLTLGK